jgi:hypothetical protein
MVHASGGGERGEQQGALAQLQPSLMKVTIAGPKFDVISDRLDALSWSTPSVIPNLTSTDDVRDSSSLGTRLTSDASLRRSRLRCKPSGSIIGPGELNSEPEVMSRTTFGSIRF